MTIDSKIFEIEAQIDDIISYQTGKFKYVGEPGAQYQLINGILHGLNSTACLGNIHIRWYYAIIFLKDHFHASYCSGDVFRFLNDCIDRSYVSTSKESLLSAVNAAEPVPAWIDKLAVYITLVARLGLILAAKQRGIDNYCAYQAKKINHLLPRLLGALAETQFDQSKSEFLLSVHLAGIHLTRKLFSSFPALVADLKAIWNSPDYIRKIAAPAQVISRGKINSLDLFWNGFIP